MGPDREAGELFRAGGEFSGFNFASFLRSIGNGCWEMKMGMLRTTLSFGAQHKLLASLRRNVKGFFLQRFVSHAARMMRRNADEEEEELASWDFFDF